MELHFDPSAALARMDDDTELLKMLIGVFLGERQSYRQKIQSAIESASATALGDAAHTVKGASAAIGLEYVRNPAERTEKLARSGVSLEDTALQRQASELLNALDTCEPALTAWASEH